jgi:hypothetical protein
VKLAAPIAREGGKIEFQMESQATVLKAQVLCGKRQRILHDVIEVEFSELSALHEVYHCELSGQFPSQSMF